MASSPSSTPADGRERPLTDAQADSLWHRLADILNDVGIRNTVVTIAKLVQFHGMQTYASPADIPDLERDVMQLGYTYAKGAERID